MMKEPILEVKHLTTQLKMEEASYAVVDDVSFSLHLGKTLALVGESGCGKSMTALSILRVLPQPPALPPEGEVLYQGKDLLKLSEREMRKIRGANIAMIFQNPGGALNPVFTIGSQMLEVTELHLGLYGDEGIERALSALRDVHISSPEECLEAYPHQLSGGMKQRVMIAMALLCEPEVLIADEPTTALDVTIQAQVLDLMRDLQKRKGMALLLITHDMGVVAEMADDVIVMYASQAFERGDVYQIFDHKSHPYTLGLFASRPAVDTPREELHGGLTTIKGSVPPLSQYPQGCRFHPRCPFVMDKCRQGDVPAFSVHGKEHETICWLYDGSAESKKKKGKM